MPPAAPELSKSRGDDPTEKHLLCRRGGLGEGRGAGSGNLGLNSAPRTPGDTRQVPWLHLAGPRAPLHCGVSRFFLPSEDQMSDSRKVLGPELGANATAQSARGLFPIASVCVPPSLPGPRTTPSECKPSALSSSRVWRAEGLLRTPAGQTDGWKEEERPCCFPSSPTQTGPQCRGFFHFLLPEDRRQSHYFHC